MADASVSKTDGVLPRVGSSPTFGTMKGLGAFERMLPGGVVVAQGSLEPLGQVRVLAGQPIPV